MALSLLFGRKKSPADLCKSIKECLVTLDKKKDEKSIKVLLGCDGVVSHQLQQAKEDITKHLTAMKVILYGSGEVRSFLHLDLVVSHLY